VSEGPTITLVWSLNFSSGSPNYHGGDFNFPIGCQWSSGLTFTGNLYLCKKYTIEITFLA